MNWFVIFQVVQYLHVFLFVFFLAVASRLKPSQTPGLAILSTLAVVWLATGLWMSLAASASLLQPPFFHWKSWGNMSDKRHPKFLIDSYGPYTWYHPWPKLLSIPQLNPACRSYHFRNEQYWPTNSDVFSEFSAGLVGKERHLLWHAHCCWYMLLNAALGRSTVN